MDSSLFRCGLSGLIQLDELPLIPAGSQGSLLTCIVLILLESSVHACPPLFPCREPVAACLDDVEGRLSEEPSRLVEWVGFGGA